MSNAFVYSPYWRHEPTIKQMAALSLHMVEELLFGGSAGGGKSDYLLMAASQFCHDPSWNALLLRKTYKDLAKPDAIMMRAIDWWYKQDGIKWIEKDKQFIFPSGSSVSFGHLENAKAHLNYQGAAYTLIGIDEPSQIPEKQIVYMKSRLRKGTKDFGLPIQFRLASNPGDVSHNYLKDMYVRSPNTIKNVFLPSDLSDNPHLDPGYKEQLMKLDPITRAQLLEGNWDVQAGMGHFNIDDFSYCMLHDVPNINKETVRSWDIAATAPSKDRAKDPDHTVGARYTISNGQFWLEDIQRFREPPATVEHRIRKTAEVDGKGIAVVIEQEPGAAGKNVISHYTRNVLRGFSVHSSRPTGDKAERAKIFASAVANHNVYLVRAGWNKAFLDEASVFPAGDHDDQIDAVSQAMGHLVSRKVPKIFAGAE